MMTGLLLLAALSAPDPPPNWAATAMPDVCEADLLRFPVRNVAFDELRWNRGIRDAIANQARFQPAFFWQYKAILDDLDVRFRAWDALDWAHLIAQSAYRSEDDETQLLRWLETLRDLIGPEAYYGGVMPLAVEPRNLPHVD